jgi:hypothetical protein
VALFAAATAVAEETKIIITKKDCRRLVRHTASADVAYRPGVEVRGLQVGFRRRQGAGSAQAADIFEFNIDVDIRKHLGGLEADTAATSAGTSASDSATSNTALIATNRKAQKFADLNMTVGKVRYNIKTGALTFNRQSLTDPNQDALAAACRSILKGGK